MKLELKYTIKCDCGKELDIDELKKLIAKAGSASSTNISIGDYYSDMEDKERELRKGTPLEDKDETLKEEVVFPPKPSDEILEKLKKKGKGKIWTDEEITVLKKLREERLTAKEIALEMNRSVFAVKGRLRKLGIPLEKEKKEPSFKCSYCSKKFSDLDSLDKHNEHAHPEDDEDLFR